MYVYLFQGSSDVSVKRRKIGTSDGESDSDGEGRVGRKRAADSRETAVAEPPVPRRPVDLIVLGVNYKTTDEGFKSYFEAFGTVVFAEAADILPDEYSTSYGRLHLRYVLIVGGPISATDRPQSIRNKDQVATAMAMLGAIPLEEYTGRHSKNALAKIP
ncbi:hypothetical protein Y032_0026g1418 [Ancylostoma ceylanicum]|uniref:RRM domain-containing protein n=1 Tax=Ancylostoma ceylanicum TaxID=53326 RepID=A0A016UUJ2_9BILA|nr:hypothetical protein Y032_0026g1418 [Ancylostoma ceylanicum]